MWGDKIGSIVEPFSPTIIFLHPIMPGIRYTEEVQQAIRLVLESNTPIAQAARTIGCSLGTLNRWLRQHRHVADDVQSSEAATFIPVNIIDHKSPIEIGSCPKIIVLPKSGFFVYHE
jgi:predicted DNA-binding protein (UPF0251 family)